MDVSTTGDHSSACKTLVMFPNHASTNDLTFALAITRTSDIFSWFAAHEILAFVRIFGLCICKNLIQTSQKSALCGPPRFFNHNRQPGPAKWMVRGATKQLLRVQTPPLGGCWKVQLQWDFLNLFFFIFFQLTILVCGP